ncbi:MAG: 5-dehydro-4-deoxyglucarate dehydratase [Verrucomicrobiota bacterium]
MKPQELRSKLSSGVISFPVTPFKANLSLDIAAYRKNMRHILKYPVAAVVAAAGTGEMYSLTPEEHLEVVKATVAEVKGKVPVIAGTGFNYPLSIRIAKQSADAGADGILALPPYYPNADEEALLEYYKAIGKATKLGLLVYSRDWVNPGAAFVQKLADAAPTLIAWKDGQADTRKYQIIMNRVGDRLHWIGGAGDDAVPAYYSIGIRTYTSSIATITPGLSYQLHETASAGNSAKLGQLMRDYVTPLYAFRARRKGYEVTVMKEAMNLIGLNGGVVRPPLPTLRPEEVKELAAMLVKWKPVL